MTAAEEILVYSHRIDTPRASPDGERWPAHAHEEHELLSSITGAVTVLAASTAHVVPRGASVWIPAGVAHEVIASAGNSMRCTWFSAEHDTAFAERVAVVTTSPLLDDVLAHLATCEDAARRARAEAFVLDLLELAGGPEAGLPLPVSPWLAAVAGELAARPGDHRTVAEWAALAAVSVRTLTRRFRFETGMSFSDWRSQLRLRAAMTRLAAGADVGAVAREVDFESGASFATAFRRLTGVAPTVFARGSAAD